MERFRKKADIKYDLVASKLLQQIKKEEDYWREILEWLNALVIKYLLIKILGFKEVMIILYTYTPGKGNFLKFFGLLALFDDKMKKHIRRIENNELTVHYLGKYTKQIDFHFGECS